MLFDGVVRGGPRRVSASDSSVVRLRKSPSHPRRPPRLASAASLENAAAIVSSCTRSSSSNNSVWSPCRLAPPSRTCCSTSSFFRTFPGLRSRRRGLRRRPPCEGFDGVDAMSPVVDDPALALVVVGARLAGGVPRAPSTVRIHGVERRHVGVVRPVLVAATPRPDLGDPRRGRPRGGRPPRRLRSAHGRRRSLTASSVRAQVGSSTSRPADSGRRWSPARRRGAINEDEGVSTLVLASARPAPRRRPRPTAFFFLAARRRRRQPGPSCRVFDVAAS